MSDDETKLLDNPLSFEARVLAQLESVNSRLAALEKRAAERDLETRPGVERILSEFQDMQTTINAYFANFDGKLDVMNSELLQVKVDQRAMEKRVRSIEAENRPQVITQDKGF